MTKISVARALTAYIAQRTIVLITLIACAVLMAVFIGCALLAHFFSGWWWLLLVPFLLLFMVFLVMRFVVVLIIRQIHGEKLNKTQRQAMDDFVDKIQGLLEARATPFPIFALITLKDLLMHRDVTTIRKLISDTSGLKRDFEALERLF